MGVRWHGGAVARWCGGTVVSWHGSAACLPFAKITRYTPRQVFRSRGRRAAPRSRYHTTLMSADAPQPIVSARGLTKHFKDARAVDGVDFDIAPNECVGFLGPNGAGKTTLLRMIYNAIQKSAGELTVFGMTPMVHRKQINTHIGVVFQDNNLDQELNAAESLLVHALYCGVGFRAARRRIADLLEWMSLTAKARSTIRELSGGMVRRLMIARALLNSPKLLILDEPTTGLDPQVRHTIWAMLRELKRHGLTILLTTHYMDEAQQLSDRVMIMDHGRIILSGRAGDADYFYSDDEGPLRELYEHLPTKNAVLRHANLEDVFLKFTGRGLSE